MKMYVTPVLLQQPNKIVDVQDDPFVLPCICHFLLDVVLALSAPRVPYILLVQTHQAGCSIQPVRKVVQVLLVQLVEQFLNVK